MSCNAVLGDLECKIFLSPYHGGRQLRYLLRLFALGNLTNHFWKVKSNPGSLCFVETWVVSQQDISLIKSFMSDIIIVLKKHVVEKNSTWFCGLQRLFSIQDSNFFSVNERFGIFTENKKSIFWINNAEREGKNSVKSVHFEFWIVSYGVIFLFEIPKFVL